MTWLVASMVVGVVLGRLMGTSSVWLVLLSAAVAIGALGTSNLFQTNKGLHYKGKAWPLSAAYASGVILGVTCVQLWDMLTAGGN